MNDDLGTTTNATIDTLAATILPLRGSTMQADLAARIRRIIQDYLNADQHGLV